ncbi:serine hydrolase domain-containing protein [Chryseobacterium sp. M5A1_1a]
MKNQTQTQISDYLSRFNQNDPGFTYMIKYDSGTEYKGAIGLASLDPKKDLNIQDVFNLASLSKQFTAFAILLLEQEGKLSLDDSLYKYMPELGKYVKSITLLNLIHHTSGLSDYMELAEKYNYDTTVFLSSEQTLKHLSTLDKTEFEPGSKFEYSNTGYFLLSQIVEKVSGQSMKDFCKERIFDPLQMKNTFVVDSYPIKQSYVLSYDDLNNAHEIIWNHTGDGAVHSNVIDLMLWGENMSSCKVGGKSLLEKFFTPLSALNANGQQVIDYEKYAFGNILDSISDIQVLEHSGSWASYASNFIRIPDKKITIVVLTNNTKNSAIEISHQLATIILQ